MVGDMSDRKKEETGIRQGCTLSFVLFTLILSAAMHDATARVRQRHSFVVTPMMPTLNLESADDTVLIARTAEIASGLLHEVEVEAAKYGLHLNEPKTCRIARDSKETVHFADGTPVPRAVQTVYLGALIREDSDPGPEIKARIGRARSICTALRPFGGSRALDVKDFMRVLTPCVFSALTYSLQTLYTHTGHGKQGWTRSRPTVRDERCASKPRAPPKKRIRAGYKQGSHGKGRAEAAQQKHHGRQVQTGWACTKAAYIRPGESSGI